MKCTSCGKELADTAKFCTGCGTPTQQIPAEEVQPPVEEAAAVATVVEAPAPAAPAAAAEPVLPPQNRPLNPWAYYGLQLLFSIPLVGFICLIIFSLNNNNINRRNFARSYWCSLLVNLVVIILTVVVLIYSGAAANIMETLSMLGSLPL